MDRVNMTQAKHKLDRRIGMVSARLEHLLRIESYGLQRIELVILHREEEQATREVLKRMGAEISVHCPLFRDCGLDDYPLHASVFDTDEERRRRSLALMERELVQAAELGARHLVVHLQRAVGVLDEPVPPGWTEERALDVATEGALRLVEVARQVGVPLHFENMMGQPLLCRPEHYMALMEALPADLASICLDVGHAAFDGAKYGFEVEEFARSLAPRIGSLHVYNNQVDSDFDFATLREEGRLRKFPAHPDHDAEAGWIDLERVLGAVLATNPEALVTFEVYFSLDVDREVTREGLEWIERVCRKWWPEDRTS